jgi:hypothetical protein
MDVSGDVVILVNVWHYALYGSLYWYWYLCTGLGRHGVSWILVKSLNVYFLMW